MINSSVINGAEINGSATAAPVILRYFDGYISDLTGEFIAVSIPDNGNYFDGNISDLTGYFGWGAKFDGKIDSLTGSFTGVWQPTGGFNGAIDSLTGSFLGVSVKNGYFDGYISDITGYFGWGCRFDGAISSLTGLFTGEYVTSGRFDGEISGLEGSFTGIAIASGYFDGSIDGLYPGYYASFDGYIDDLSGDFVSAFETFNFATVMNVATNECTRYTNYSFNSIAQINGKDYGFSNNALYALEGDTDNGDEIVRYVITNETDNETMHSKRCVYLYLDNESRIKVTPITRDSAIGQPQVNASHYTSFAGNKCHLSRGLSSRYWQFKFEEIKRLGAVEIIFENRQRRIK